MLKYLLILILLLHSTAFGATNVDTDSNTAIDIAYGGTNSAAGMTIATRSTGVTLTCAQVSNVFNVTDAAITLTLPGIDDSGCGLGTYTCFYVQDASEQLIIDTDANDNFRLDTTPLDDGDKLSGPANGAGSFVCIIAAYLSSVNGQWIVLGRSGTWTDGGP